MPPDSSGLGAGQGPPDFTDALWGARSLPLTKHFECLFSANSQVTFHSHFPPVVEIETRRRRERKEVLSGCGRL